jgi:leucyl aminopeptidase
MRVQFSAAELPASGFIAVGVLDERRLTVTAQALDDRLGGSLTRAMASSRFRGKRGTTLAVLAPAGSRFEGIFLYGLGPAAELDALKSQAAGGALQAALAGSGADSVVVILDGLEGCRLAATDIAVEMAFGATLRAYRFDKYRTKEKEDDKPSLQLLTFACDGAERATKAFAARQPVAEAVAFTRDIVSEPANVIHPQSLAEQAAKLAASGVEVEVLGEAEMRHLGMNALLGVGQGSARESQLVVMQWWGAGRPPGAPSGDAAAAAPAASADSNESGPIVLIGKGVTFDTGGISIKPAANMEDMKWDMAGAAAVIGAMRALAARRARANVVGIVGLVENMPSGTAQRPGDVVTSLSGQTIEVINTDAEGRLVLCDCLTYAKQRFQPRAMLDLATLTGAIIIALGHEQAGVFANDDTLAAQLIAAGAAVGEPLWRMPLGEEYDKLIKSDIADMKNVGNRGAGSITAAQFLQRFVGKTPWAHLDIAGVAWSTKDRDLTPKGASGFGVRLIDRFIADTVEAAGSAPASGRG